MKNELVSIVMATYNGEKYLRQQLDSIFAQTYPHFELIVVDDASTDETLSILNEYAAKDSRAYVFPAKQNLGLVANFERGLKLAQGEFIALADQDDVFRKDKIERLINTLKTYFDCDLVFSDLSLIDEEGNEFAPSMRRYQGLKPKQGKPFRRLLRSNFATGCAMMFRSRLLKMAIPFPQDCVVHDWWLVVVASSAKGRGICLVEEPLTAYRQHRANVLGAMAADDRSAWNMIGQINAPSRGLSVLEERIRLYNRLHISRLTGYLQRPIWSVTERRIIEQNILLYADYQRDGQRNLLCRIAKLPQRLHHAMISGGLASCYRTIMETLSPYK
jgi:glycosyltransferase involved in cell wall biosynthesis